MKTAFALIAATSMTPAVARADILYAMDRGTFTRIDTDTLTATPIGASGFPFIHGLEFDDRGRLFGVAAGTDELVRIDMATGAASVVGSFGSPVSSSTGLGWDPTTNRMYGTLKFSLGSPDILASINLETGGASFMTEITGIGNASLDGLEFDESGQLYGIQNFDTSQLFAINKVTGQATPIGIRDLPSFSSLTISPDGTAWSISSEGHLHSIDLELGLATDFGLITGFQSGDPIIVSLTSIPSPSSLMAVVVGLVLSRRRTRQL